MLDAPLGKTKFVKVALLDTFSTLIESVPQLVITAENGSQMVSVQVAIMDMKLLMEPVFFLNIPQFQMLNQILIAPNGKTQFAKVVPQEHISTKKEFALQLMTIAIHGTS